jgi:hypothetical protein
LPTFIFQIIITLAKNIKRLAYEITFLLVEIYIFRVTNKTFSKYRKAKKTRVRQGNIFIIRDKQDILIQKDIDKQVQRDIYTKKNNRKEEQLTRKRCNTCRKTSHNTRTCQVDIDISSLSDSE